MRLPLWLRPSALLSRLPRRRLVAPARTETAVLEKQLELAVPSPAWGWIALAAVLIVAAVAATLWWLLNDPPATPDAVRTALLAGAGVGGALTLMLAFRRQRQQELQSAVTAELTRRGLDSTTHDAAERRVTELYTKAADQLGSDKAAVRLAGLYALERLAQDNPGHQQTVVNVICAYLRMPYALPEASPPASSPPGPWQRTGTASPGRGDEEEERQVRLAAQRILADHLRDDRTPQQREQGKATGPRFWEGMHIDLTGAALIDFNFHSCHTTDAEFSGATFTGDAEFSGATFTGDAEFPGVTFTGDAEFSGATFTENAVFPGVTFTENAVFSGATFTGIAWFDGATFTGIAGFSGATFTVAGFDGATFTGDAGFERATFIREARFEEVTFTEDAWFNGATFIREARFEEVTFTRNAGFEEVTFTGIAWFDGATFTEGAWFKGATFTRDAVFERATFTGIAGFKGATFTGDAGFKEATFPGIALFDEAVVTTPTGNHVWPEGWRVVVRADDTGRLKRGVEPEPTPEEENLPALEKADSRDKKPVLPTADPGDPAEPMEPGETV